VSRHKFITISAPLKDVKIVLRDSQRIFPVSLQELCEVFKVKGKFSKYNPEFNKLSILKPGNPLNKLFLTYAIQDSIALLQAMSKAQIIYYEKHHVDICSIVSTASLFLKIFRTNYLSFPIPVLNKRLDDFIRFSYYGFPEGNVLQIIIKNMVKIYTTMMLILFILMLCLKICLTNH
jgi:DNA polymerase type B, organellar and viral